MAPVEAGSIQERTAPPAIGRSESCPLLSRFYYRQETTQDGVDKTAIFAAASSSMAGIAREGTSKVMLAVACPRRSDTTFGWILGPKVRAGCFH